MHGPGCATDCLPRCGALTLPCALPGVLQCVRMLPVGLLLHRHLYRVFGVMPCNRHVPLRHISCSCSSRAYSIALARPWEEQPFFTQPHLCCTIWWASPAQSQASYQRHVAECRYTGHARQVLPLSIYDADAAAHKSAVPAASNAVVCSSPVYFLGSATRPVYLVPSLTTAQSSCSISEMPPDNAFAAQPTGNVAEERHAFKGFQHCEHAVYKHVHMPSWGVISKMRRCFAPQQWCPGCGS